MFFSAPGIKIDQLFALLSHDFDEFPRRPPLCVQVFAKFSYLSRVSKMSKSEMQGENNESTDARPVDMLLMHEMQE